MNKIFLFKGVDVGSTSIRDIIQIFFFRIISLLILAGIVMLAVIGLQVGTVAIVLVGTISTSFALSHKEQMIESLAIIYVIISIYNHYKDKGSKNFPK